MLEDHTRAASTPLRILTFSGPCQVFMAGFLPFSAIYIELHYIFASVWGHKLYTLYGILFLAVGMLFIVTSFITVALTYFQLAIEDHRWWWRSFFSGGSTGFFVFAYCFFYYFERSAMFGFMQVHVRLCCFCFCNIAAAHVSGFPCRQASSSGTC